MKKTKNSAWKRVAAGALSMALVAGAMPANVGGFLTGGNAIVAHAETAYTAAQTRVGLKLNVGDSFVIPESTHVNRYENMISWDGSTYDIGTQARTITVVRGENGALKLDGLDGVEQNFTYPELESSTDQLCIIEYDNYSGWYLCGLARCNAFTGVTSVDEINSYGDTIDGCDVTKVENFMSDNCNVTISNIGSGKKVRLTYSDNTTNDIEPTEGTVTFTSALDADFANETNKKVNSVEIVPIPTDLTAEDYTAPVGGTISYTGEAVSLLTDDNKGSVATYTGTETAKGTMEYGIAGTKEATNIIKNNESEYLYVDEVAVGKIYSPVGNVYGVNFRIADYGKFILDDKEYESEYTYTALAYQNGRYYMTAGYEDPGLKDGCDAVRVKEIRSDAIVFESYNSALETIDWKNTVPTAKDVGEYKVYYRVKGDANHNDTAPAFVTSAIEYATASLTLSPSLTGAVIVENGATEALEATDGVYTLAGTKKYNIYTNKSIADSTAATALDLTSKSSNKTFGGNTYSYRYEIEVPTTPAEGGYILSHTNNYVGKVSTEVGKANVMNIQEDGVTTENVAVLNADGVIYYGDQLEKDELVTIADGYGSIVNVDEIYLENNTASGGKVTGDALVIGTTYLLTAKVSVDADGDPDNGISGNTIYLKQQVTYAARPMTMNEYALKTEDGLVPLEVSDGTVNVPAEYWVCTLKDDSSKTYIRVEEPEEALSALITWEKKSTFVYNSAAQKPVIVVKNGGDNTIVLADTAVAANETATPPVAAVAKDYNNAVAEKTDAGSYNYALTAETNGNYAGSVTVAWSIAQADVSDYITVAPKNNVDTDGNKETLEAVVYDGAVLDGTDFEVKTNEAYTQLAADSPVKKLVDEFIDQLKAKEAVAADPANNIEAQPAVPVKTFVNVSSGRYGVTTDITYENETPSSGASINDNTVGSYSNVILKGNLTFQSTGGDITNAKITCGEYEKLKSNNVELTLDGNSIMCGDDTILTKNDNEWFKIESITHQIGNETNEYTINLTKVPKTETRYETYDIKNAGAHKANVTVSNSNFKTVEFKQKIDNSGKPVEDEDNSVAVTIAKRDVTLTPDEDLSMTYRDTEMPDLTYTIEDAKADGLTGVVAADKALFQKTTGEGSDAVTTNTGAIYVDKLVQEDAQAVPVQFVYATDENNDIDYTTAGLNNAGSYTYAVSEDDKFANYNIVLPIDIAADEAQGIEEYTAPTFTVDPLNLKNIENLNIVLNGVTTGWTQNGSSGSYTYDGTTKAVSVKKVSKSGNGESVSAEFSSQELVREHEGQDYSATKNDVTVYCKNKTDSSGEPILLNNENDIRLEVSDGMIIESVELQLVNAGTYIINGNEYTTDNWKLTIPGSAISDNRITCSDAKVDCIKVNCTTGDEYVLEADTDYTVGGMTKSATVGEKTVQVKGKGNYTGVAKAKWEMKPVDDVESLVTFKINDDARWTVLTQDVQYYNWYYTGEPISCGAKFTDPDSNYAQDAEVTVKYTRFNNITGEYEEVDEAVHQGKYKVNVKIECEGYSPVEFNYDINISPKEILLEDTPFTINYGEDYSDHTDELLALFVENGLLQSDADLIKKLLEDGTLIWYYDYDEYYDEGWLYPTWSEDVLEAAAEEAVKEGKDPEDWTVINSMIHKLYGDAIYQVANANDNDIILANPIIKPKSIKSDDVTVEFTNGNTVVLDENGFAAESSIIVKDTGILNDDGEPTVLLADTDYELNIESTATEGEYIVEIVGKNNYRGVRKIEFKAITAAKAATTFDIDFVETYVSNNKNRIRFNAAASVKSGYTVKETGVLYFNAATGAPQAELTMENIGGDIKKARNLSDSYLVGLLDNGNGVYARFYSIVNDGTNDYVVYATDEAVYYNYAELSAKTATTFDIDLVETYVSNNKNRIRFNAAASVKSGYTVKEVGVLYFNAATGAPQAELTMENIGGDIKKARNLSDSYLVGLLDNGNGVYARFYTIVNDGTNDYVVYATDEAEYYNYNQLNAEKATTLDVAFVETYVSNNKNRIRLNATASVEGSYTVKEVGVLYFNAATGTPQAELTMENIGGDIKKARNLSDSYLVGLLDNGNSVYARFYTIVNDGTNDYVVYATDKAVIYNYAELSASLS